MGRRAGAAGEGRVGREGRGERLGAGRRGGQHARVRDGRGCPAGRRGVRAAVRAVGDGHRAGEGGRAAGPGDADVDRVGGVDGGRDGQIGVIAVVVPASETRKVRVTSARPRSSWRCRPGWP